jgi:hypothetical protein
MWCRRYGQAIVKPKGKLMQNPDQLRATLTSSRFDGHVFPDAQNAVSRLAQDVQRNKQFIELLNAFRCSGGLARMPEVAARFQLYGEREVSPLVGWIKRREVICIEWQSMRWMPLFQFNPVGLTVRAGLSGVLAELIGVYDDRELASWFAKPNPWLEDCAPADMMTVATPRVLNAGRAERFVAAG